ncbi:uncharacterized protein LOC105009844 isoform X2 [Esox lucius]|uniref:uncharacterized protein LOC105009844 isoform X2 n=1 Tax=Esox lucius TaxID=8010 RepID=UPI0014774E3C|nr:uncharacterized protein LOC105009844 isoform X2 [Esox lucius]
MTLFIPDMAAGHMFLVFLIFYTFQYVKAQDRPKPSLTLNHAVIRERESIQLICETPSVSESQCHFIIEGKQISHPSPCQSTLTGYQLLHWAGQSSPVEVKILCFYMVETNYSSTHSDPVSLRILDQRNLPQPNLIVIPTVIREGDSVQLSCVTPQSLSECQCGFYEDTKLHLPERSCEQTVTGTQLLSWAGQKSSAVLQVQCFYVVERYYPSPSSKPVIVTVQGSTTSLTSMATSSGLTTPLTPSKAVNPTSGSTTSLTPTAMTSGLTTPLTPSKAVNPTSGSTTSLTPTAMTSGLTTPLTPSKAVNPTSVKPSWLAAIVVGISLAMFLVVGLTAVCLYKKTHRSKSQRPQAKQDKHKQQLVMTTESSGTMVHSGDKGPYTLIPTVLTTFMPSALFVWYRSCWRK